MVAGDVFVSAADRKSIKFETRLARVGEMLVPGTSVFTGTRDSACTLQLAEKEVQIGLDPESTLVWRGGTHASEDGLTVELVSGKVASSVDPTKGVKYTVRTEVGFARAIGTLFTVTLTNKATTGEKDMKNPSIMVTRVARGIVLVGSLSGLTRPIAICRIPWTN